MLPVISTRSPPAKLVVAFIATPLSLRLFVYSFASAVVGFVDSGARGRLAKYQNAPRAAMATIRTTTIVGLTGTRCSVLLATDSHLLNQNRRAGHRTTKHQVVPDLLNAIEHLGQSTRNRDFRNRKRKLAVFNPQTRCAARIIARDCVDALADQFRHIKPVFHRTDD